MADWVVVKWEALIIFSSLMSCFALCIKLYLPEQFEILWNEALHPATVRPLSWHLAACLNLFLFMFASLWSPSIQAPKQQLPQWGQQFRTDELVKLSTIVTACWPWQILDQSRSTQTSNSRYQNVSDCCPWKWHISICTKCLAVHMLHLLHWIMSVNQQWSTAIFVWWQFVCVDAQ